MHILKEKFVVISDDNQYCILFSFVENLVRDSCDLEKFIILLNPQNECDKFHAST